MNEGWKLALAKGAVFVALAAFGSMPDEQSAAFSIRFEKLPSETAVVAGIACSADAEGRLKLVYRAMPTEIVGDYVVETPGPVAKPGEWLHVESSYSLIRRRAALHVNGVYQWENDNLNLPRLQDGVADAAAKGVSVKDLKRFDCAVTAEEMTGVAEQRRAALVKANEGFFSARLEAGAKGVTDRAAAAFTDPLSQDPVLPREIPPTADFAGETTIFACPGEFEPVSVVLFARGNPLALKGVKVEGLPADVKYVKRWIRSGGAWLCYHNDRRGRFLTPDLLVNDLDVIRVDEERSRNYLRLDYPEGRMYVDVSDPAKHHEQWNGDNIPLRDAETLRPCTIDAGRNQQLLVTFAVPKDAKPGLVPAKVRLMTDAGELALTVNVKVLPIDLPVQPSPYLVTNRSYITHMNSLAPIRGATYEERLAFAKKELKSCHEHNMNHTTSIYESKELAQLALEAGFVPDRAFTQRDTGRPALWTSKFGINRFPITPKTNDFQDLSLADREEGLEKVIADKEKWNSWFREMLPGCEHFWLFASERGGYVPLCREGAQSAEGVHRVGGKLFAHGWHPNTAYALDIQDMHSIVGISPREAESWHAVGGEIINYADPFPGTENPFWYRRKMGLQMWRSGYDGQMMHGFANQRSPWNEFAEDWWGDGNYRNFCLCYPQQNGLIYKLAWEGVREAYDDLRYLTKLQSLALPYRNVADEHLRREAKRALAWIDRIDAVATDPKMVRAGAARRILILQDLVADIEGGKGKHLATDVMQTLRERPAAVPALPRLGLALGTPCAPQTDGKAKNLLGIAWGGEGTWNYNFRPYGKSSEWLWSDSNVNRGSGDDSEATKTGVSVSCDEDGFVVRVFCGVPDKDVGLREGKGVRRPSIESFFVSGDYETGRLQPRYHTFYSNGKLQEFEQFNEARRYRKFNDGLRVLERAVKDGYVVEYRYDWAAIFDKLPLFDDRKDNLWRLSVIRHDGGRLTWGGTVHQDSQAGYIRWPAFTPEQRTAILKATLVKGWTAYRALADSATYCLKPGAAIDYFPAKYDLEDRALHSRSYYNYQEDVTFRPVLEKLIAERDALGAGIADFAKMSPEEQEAFYAKASEMLFNFRYDVEEAYAENQKEAL